MHGRPVQNDIGESTPSHPDRWRILGVLVLALLVTSIDHTIINVALPQMVVDLGASASQLQWIVASYTVVFAGLLLTAGSLGDRVGRKHALAAGLVTFLAGSIISAMAASTTQVIVGRSVMGVGGALIMPTTLSILVNVFGDPRERNRAIAIWTAVTGAGIALGPIIGGALMRSFSWSSVFWINVPLLAIALVGTLHVVPDSRDPHATRLDLGGALLSIVAVGSLVYAVIEGPERGWTSPATMIGLMVGAMAGVMFVRWELRRDEPMLDMRLFANRGFSAGSGALALLFFAMAGTVFLQAQYLQFILGYTPLAAGVALVPAALGMILGSGAGSHFSTHIGGRIAVVTGTALAAGGVAVQAALIDGTSYLPTGIGLLLFGLGAGVAMPAATDLIMSTLPPERAGVGSAVNDTVRELGGALGVAVIGSVAASTYASDLQGRLDGLADLPDSVRATLTDNVGAAPGASTRLGPDGTQVAAAARSAFIESMSSSLWVGVALAALASVIAYRYLPRSAPTHGHHEPGQNDEHEVAELPPAEVHAAPAVRRRSHTPGQARHAARTTTALVAIALALLATACGTSNPQSGPTEAVEAPAASPNASPKQAAASVERPTETVDRMVRIDSGRHHLRCVGEGSTTVLLMAGWDDAGEGWQAIEPSIAERARVCSYSRLGTGTSDPQTEEQTFVTQAADLQTLLEGAGEPGPYVAVGHSFGGAEAVTFADHHPDEVVGLLLLDATPTTWPEAVCAVPADGTTAAQDLRGLCALMRDPSKDAERVDVFPAFAEAAMIRSLGDLPMTVMTADRRTLAADLAQSEVERLNTIWNEGVEDWAERSSASNIVTVEHTGHHIEIEHPDLVADAVLALVP